jgi:hypothetical protein
MNQIIKLLTTGFLTFLFGCGSSTPITFKGIPFDKSGFNSALQTLCREDQSNTEYNCGFAARTDLIMWVSYGVLTHNLATIKLSDDRSLMQVELTGSTSEMLAQVEVFTSQYGEPSKSTEQITNGIGMKFDKQIFIWTDNYGTRITVESLYSKIDEGRIVIDSSSYVKALKSAEKSLIESGKENL